MTWNLANELRCAATMARELDKHLHQIFKLAPSAERQRLDDTALDAVDVLAVAHDAERLAAKFQAEAEAAE